MPYLTRKITGAEYTETGGQRDKYEDNRIGTVTVFYSNGTFQEFSGILRSEFFQWERRHWDYRRPPTGVTVKKPDVNYTRWERIEQDLEAEQAEQDLEDAAYARRQRMFHAASLALEMQIGTEKFKQRFPGFPVPSEQLDAEGNFILPAKKKSEWQE